MSSVFRRTLLVARAALQIMFVLLPRVSFLTMATGDLPSLGSKSDSPGSQKGSSPLQTAWILFKIIWSTVEKMELL